MVSLERFIEDTNKASTSKSIFELYKKALGDYGYDGICYCLVTDHPTYGLHANHGEMQNYSDDWVQHYAEKNYREIDPILQHCFKTNQIFSWDNIIQSKNLAKDELLLMNEAREANLLQGLALPIHGLNGELAALGLASTGGTAEINKDVLSKIRALSVQFHIAYMESETRISHEYRENVLTKNTNIILSEREREVLLWMSEGKSDSVISEILGISYSTVRYHTNSLFIKLGVNERTLAVVKAIRHGLIMPTYLKRI
ncbi:MAG: helix-turn-helix transcriptional regulator [Alphaproteobacteria bacterium]